MSNDHFLGLPKFVWEIKIAQLVLSVIILALSAFNVAVVAFNAHALAVFTVSPFLRGDTSSSLTKETLAGGVHYHRFGLLPDRSPWRPEALQLGCVAGTRMSRRDLLAVHLGSPGCPVRLPRERVLRIQLLL
nr:hypothetical protein CFP56_44404 [Quercus suber]